MSVQIENCYLPSPEIVAREIEGELIIVPIVSGIGDLEDELYTLNETGRHIWRHLDGRTTLARIIKMLADEYQGSPGEIEADVLGLVEELYKRKILVTA